MSCTQAVDKRLCLCKSVEKYAEAANRAEAKMDDSNTASTSWVGKQCGNCEGDFTPTHQCDIPLEPALGSPPALKPTDTPLGGVPKCQVPSVASSDAVAVDLQRPRGLNITTFCRKCEERHPVRQKCQRQSATAS